MCAFIIQFFLFFLKADHELTLNNLYSNYFLVSRELLKWAIFKICARLYKEVFS